MKAGFRMMDSDIHVEEPSHFLTEYLDEPYRSKTRVFNERQPGEVALRIVYELDGKRFGGKRTAESQASGGNAILTRAQRKPPLHAYRDLDVNDLLNGMDVEGLDVGVVFPSRGNGLMALFENISPDHGNAIAQAYNSWMHDFCGVNGKRLKPSAILNYMDPVAAAAEARRAAEELGAVAFSAPCTVVNGHQPHDAFYDPLWTELNRLGVPICYHPSGAPSQEGSPKRLIGQLNSGTIEHSVFNPFCNMMNVASFTVGGIFERFPNLKAGFLETGASWTVWLLSRLDDQWELFGPDESWSLSMKPSEYFRRQGWVAVEPDEENVKYVVDYLGEDRVVVSTDFPHPDCKYPEAMNQFVALEGITDPVKQKILWDNCAGLYNLDLETADRRLASDRATSQRPR